MLGSYYGVCFIEVETAENICFVHDNGATAERAMRESENSARHIESACLYLIRYQTLYSHILAQKYLRLVRPRETDSLNMLLT